MMTMMIATTVSFHILFFTIVGCLVCAQCNIPPLKLAWGNTTVTDDGLGVARGIEIGIGTPEQIFAFRPSTTLNNTLINNVLSCGSAANDSCVGSLGGAFTPSKSRTYSVSIKAQWNGSQIDAQSSTGAYVYFNDAVNFQSNGHVDGFPLVMDSEIGGGGQSGLPLGTNSSFLRAAVEASTAPSEAFGLWTGSRSVAPVDGLLIIGGYDRSRIAGPFTNFSVGKWDLKRACPLQVTVADVAYAGRSLFNGSSQKFIACIEPATQRSVFPPSIATQFGIVTGQNSTLYPKGMQYNVTQRPTGNLTITLDNGYQSSISNEELFAPLRGSDQYGRYAITNDSVLDSGVADNRKSDPSSVNPTLGGLFLTFNYLFVDYASGSFSLAPAVSSSNTSSPVDLASVCTPTPVPVPSSSPIPPSKSATNVGAIAGGVVGGVAGLVLLSVLIWFLLRRRRRGQRDADRQNSLSQANGQPQHHTSPPMSPASRTFSHEIMPTEKRLDVYELPSAVQRPEHRIPRKPVSSDHNDVNSGRS